MHKKIVRVNVTPCLCDSRWSKNFLINGFRRTKWSGTKMKKPLKVMAKKTRNTQQKGLLSTVRLTPFKPTRFDNMRKNVHFHRSSQTKQASTWRSAVLSPFR
jgi:hypothetical protein